MSLANIDISYLKHCKLKIEAMLDSDENEFIDNKKNWQREMIEQTIDLLKLIQPY